MYILNSNALITAMHPSYPMKTILYSCMVSTAGPGHTAGHTPARMGMLDADAPCSHANPIRDPPIPHGAAACIADARGGDGAGGAPRGSLDPPRVARWLLADIMAKCARSTPRLRQLRLPRLLLV